MKICKTLLILFCLTYALKVEAQFQKGSILLEGGAGFSFNFKNDGDGEDYKPPYSVSIGFKSGYFLSEKNEIGIGLNWERRRGNSFFIFGPDVNIFVQSQSSVTPSIYWRNYRPIGERLLLSFSTGADMSFSKSKEEDFGSGATTENEFFQLRVGFAPSLVYMLNSKLGLRGNFGNVGFDFGKQKGVDFWEKSFSASFSPRFLNFGLFFVLNGAQSND